MNKPLILLLLCCSLSAMASGERRYISPMELSRWTLTADTPLLCQIEHQIPRFGKAMFYRESGRQLRLKLISDHPFEKGLEVAFRSVTANWQPVSTQAVLGDLQTSGSNNPLVDIVEDNARQAYFELQQGYQPSLFFIDDQDGSSPVSVVLSTVRFRDVEAAFGRCMTRLYPYHFNDIRIGRVYFGFDEEFPSTGEEERVLEPMLEYLELDPSVSRVIIRGHTDFKGSQCYNHKLSARRARYVYDYLLQAGIDQTKLQLEAHGETRPRDARKGEPAAANNRRVVIEMLR